jgi:thiamine biosynthesis protein ThiS
MNVVINGESKTLEGPLTVEALLQEMGLGPERVAVELNRAVLPRAQHAGTVLRDGDQVEVVTFVGGG